MSDYIIPIPETIELINDRGNLVIRKRWWNWKFIIFTVFAVIWNVGVVVFYVTISQTDAPTFAMLIPLIHAVMGLVFAYYTIAGYVNKTDITVSRMSIKVRSYPLKWIGDKEISVTSTKQLYTKRVIRKGKGGNSEYFQVHIIHQNDQHEKLIGGLHTQEEGLAIEKKIENFLGIEDRPVAGEV